MMCKALLPLIIASLIGTASAADPKAARYYEDALTRYEKNDMAGAIIQLKNALKIDDSMLAVQLLLAKALMRHGEVIAAEAALNQAVSMGISRAEVAAPLAQTYIMLGKPEKVIDSISPSGLPLAVKVEVLSLRGTAYAEMGRFAQAADSFSEARAQDPRSDVPLIAEVPMLVRQQNMGKAREVANKAVELAPQDPLAWSTRGSVLHASRDLAGALADYDKSIALAPQLAEARVARAAILISLNRWADAEKDLAALDEDMLEEPRAAYVSALIAAHKGDTRTARDELSKSVKILDGLPRSWINYREHLLMQGAMSHYALRNWEKAREYLEAMVATNSRNAIAQQMLASTYLETKDYDRAQRLLESLNRASPDDTQIQYLLGTVYLAQRRYSQASLLLEKAAAQGTTSAATRELGLSQIELGKDTTGISNLEKVFAANPRDSRAGTQLAAIYGRKGQMKKAVQTAETLVKNDPENLALINFLGTVKGWSGDKPGARAAYSKALEKDGQFLPATLNLARLDVADEHFADARTRLLAALAKRASDPDLLYELGVLEQKAKQPAEALRYWKKADEAQKFDARPGLAMVDLQLTQGDADTALQTAKQLVQKFPDQVNMQIVLGRVYLATGDRSNAQKAFRDATRLADYNPTLQVQIGRLQLMADNPGGAAYSAQKALQEKPDDEAALALSAETETVRGDPARADAALKTLAAKYPNSVATALTTANIAMARGQYGAAASGYRNALAKQPSTATAINVVQAHMAAGEAAKAVSFIEGWAKTHPTDLTALKTLAEVQSATGQKEAARKTYIAILAAEPDDPMTLNNYAVLLQKLNDPKATEPAEKAQKLMPGNPSIADTLGWIQVQQGKIDAGLRQLRDARLRSPDNRTIRYHLAYALNKSGRKAEARSELSAALANAPAAQISSEMTQLKTELGL